MRVFLINLVVLFFVISQVFLSCGEFEEDSNDKGVTSGKKDNSQDKNQELTKVGNEHLKNYNLLPNPIPFDVSRYASQRIVDVAREEIGTDDDDCSSPGCYFAGGQPWNLWCSEFVSWVYNEAGFSFTGGTQSGGWMLSSTFSIIPWFQNNRDYVDRNNPFWYQIADYIKPGDYVFIGRANTTGGYTTRRHSGIVEYVEKRIVTETLKDRCTIKTVYDLHTMEGNNDSRPVARYVYPDFVNNFTSNLPENTNGIVRGIGLRNGFIEFENVATRTSSK